MIDQKLTEMETLFNENGSVQSMNQDAKRRSARTSQ